MGEERDYVDLDSFELMFAAGSQLGDVQCVNVSIVNDENAEDDEYFSICLESQTQSIATADENRDTALVTILSDATDSK